MRLDGGRQYRKALYHLLEMGSKSKMSKVLFWILELILTSTTPSMRST